MEALRISPRHKAEHWRKLDKSKEEDWPAAAAIVHDRLHGRFLKFADMCLKEDSSGFVVLSIDCLLVETLQQFIEGETRDWSDSERSFKRFLAGPRFATSFIPPQTRRRFYLDIRCGLLHQAEAKKKWLVRRKQAGMLRLVGPDEYIIDVELFHAAVKGSLDDYLAEILKPERADLREKLWTKMDHICNVRESRGAMEVDDSAAETKKA